MGEVVVSSEEWMDEEQEAMEMEIMKGSSKRVIRWEDFLPRMYMRVLLVEADDSTRQIISALLRKCGYKVTAVSDGSKAWAVLKGRAQYIDLVLTEVELPSISGFSLLDMIMENESCKNLPVIMMSTHDSIGVVFNFMLKGAADFFIKPVRKNELRNLWQHVWRRHNNASSGNSAQQKIRVSSENNNASNHTNESVARAQENKESSDAQSSCSKPDMEAESSRIRRSTSLPHVHQTEIQNNKETIQLDDKLPALGREGMTVQEGEHASAEKSTPLEDVVEEIHMENDNIPCENMQSGNEQVRPQREAIDLIGSFDDRRKTFAVVREVFSNNSKPYSDSNETTKKLELSLKRFNPSECEYQQTDERRSLNHSNFSAFSRYNNRTQQPFHSTLLGSNTESTECVDNSHALNQDLLNTVDAPKQNGGATLSNHEESMAPQVISQTTRAATAFPHPKFGATSFDSVSCSYGTVLPQMLYSQSCQPSLWCPNSVDFQNSSFFENSPCLIKPNNIEQIHDQSDESCTVQIMNKRQKLNLDFVENQVHFTTDTEQSRSSSLCNGGASHFDSKGYGFNCNGSTENVITAAVARETLECCRDGIRGMDRLHSTQREMALNKFRLKRKDRCFDKKVRYQSRKKLAEQRPRVKGQFVRQIAVNLPLTETKC